ncbi:uncharacterized protein LOC127861692 isoform X3 [Dreissena polymorpha]|uniref:Peptidase C45 hydrolase domain-containing protein n=1 Tax=Dreissena polymorpha TaxID=45954 RepID=A0A9D4S852_DREPO|nr:uncharacterized protein LOC127861692 isoform X1 [Dreissena polymorpha]XP_052256353.1 uncharacterized protein LOC127861692 isoform X3 [Dreissena polymorpha]KAH3894028.1 hypothetical protein DPMN_018185 [Dreissena polymorpha]
MAPCESLPILYIKASNNFDVGLAIGSCFKAWIQEYVNGSNQVKAVKDFYAVSKGKDIVSQYMRTSEEYFPDIVEEIRGIATGCCLEFIDIFLLQLMSEIEFCHTIQLENEKLKSSGKGCTGILLNTQQCRIIAHNDDWHPDVVDKVAIVHVTIDGPEAIKEQFVSYVYPGFLPGFGFQMNKHLAITLNSLNPAVANTSGVPLVILLRSLLRCKTIDECTTVLDFKPVGCSYGMTINIAEISSNRMSSVEIYTTENKSTLSVHWIEFTTENFEASFYHHENHYRECGDPAIACLWEGSIERGQRLAEKIVQFTPKNSEDALQILGDTEGVVGSLYQIAKGRHVADDIQTNATALFDFHRKLLLVYRGNPRPPAEPLLSLAFI